MSHTVYTIGHSNHTLDALVSLLREHSITRLVDVRSVPYSKYSPQFQKSQLSADLPQYDIDYRFMGDRLGGKIDVDYEARATQPDFLQAIDELIRLANTDPTTIMCAEKDPRNCHRRKLITPTLLTRHILVTHILADGTLVHDQDLDPPPPPTNPLLGTVFTS